MIKLISSILGTLFLIFFINYFTLIGFTLLGIPLWFSSLIAILNAAILPTFIITWLNRDN